MREGGRYAVREGCEGGVEGTLYGRGVREGCKVRCTGGCEGGV